jgi:hypothetical protein
VALPQLISKRFRAALAGVPVEGLDRHQRQQRMSVPACFDAEADRSLQPDGRASQASMAFLAAAAAASREG